MKKGIKLIHCSFDLVDSFVPRVPDSRVKWQGEDYEDAVTSRICVSPTVLQCLKAMPKAGEVIRWMRVVGLPPIVHAYYLQSDNWQINVHACTTGEVPDADITGEMWVLDKPTDYHRVDYEITSCFMTDNKDMFGRDVVAIHGAELRRTKYTDNLKNLIDGLGLEYGDFMRQFPWLKFRELATNVKCTDELRERREKHLKHTAFESLQKRVETYREKERQDGESVSDASAS